MTFTKSQLQALAPFEKSFRTATQSNYASNLTTSAYKTILAVYEEASGKKYHLNASCAKCVLDFLKLVGRQYFADLKAAAEVATKEAATKEEQPKKTTKKKKK